MITIIELAGWIGAGLSLYAYFLVSFNKKDGSSQLYQWLNVIASILLIVNTFAHKAYPSMFINIVWVLISMSSLAYQTRRIKAQI